MILFKFVVNYTDEVLVTLPVDNDFRFNRLYHTESIVHNYYGYVIEYVSVLIFIAYYSIETLKESLLVCTNYTNKNLLGNHYVVLILCYGYSLKNFHCPWSMLFPFLFDFVEFQYELWVYVVYVDDLMVQLVDAVS